jgi:SAM-dependent methyltransferase
MDQKQQQEIRRYLSVIKRAVSYIEAMLDTQDGGLFEQMAAASAQPKTIPPVIQVEWGQPPTIPPPLAPCHVQPQGPTPEEVARFEAARKEHIGKLMAIDCWPEAFPSFMASKTSTQDQINRANAVLDMMLDRNVEGMRFLDYGCGEGWIVQEILKRGVSEAWGYDIQKSDNWANLKGNVKMSGNGTDLPSEHFDVIMLYDVLDHCEDPVGLMARVSRCITPKGVVYVRCHPWTSRHATHLFKQGINKAYVHLFLKHQEIEVLINDKPMFTREEKKPLEAYHWWFKEFDIKKERPVKEPVSDFFHVPAFKELLANEQSIPMVEIDSFLKLMETQFIDYCLTPKK